MEIHPLPEDQSYRTCASCGADCEPEPIAEGDGLGIRVAFVCRSCGVHSVVDPFEGHR